MELSMEQLKDVISGTVNDALKPLTKVDKKHGMFPGVDPKEDKELDYGEKVVKFFRALVSGETKAISGGVDASGGFLVPEQFQAEVIRMADTYGIARRMCRRVPMKTDTVRFPKAATGVSVSWPAEMALVTKSTPTFGQITLQARKAMGVLDSSSELLEDANIDVIRYFQRAFAEALAAEEDNQLFNGTGVPFTGIFNHLDVNTVVMGVGKTAFSNVTADDLTDLIDAVTEAAETDAGFFFHKNILTHFRKLKDAQGQYIWNPPAAAAPGSIWGENYHRSTVLPNAAASGINKKFIIYGSLKHVYFGDRRQMTIKLAREAGDRYDRDMVGLRVTQRIAIEVAMGSALAVLQTAAI